MTKQPLKILYVSAEVAPLMKTGGLADVAHALPQALLAAGHDVRVVMPCYASIPQNQRGVLRCTCYVNLDGSTQFGALRKTVIPDTSVPLYLVEHDVYFNREHPYGYGPGWEYGDNLQRFCFFSMAALDGAAQLWKPDIVHCNDWHTAMIPAYLRVRFRNHPLWGHTPSLFTIHNLGYQGRFNAQLMKNTGLGWEYFSPEYLEFHSGINLMKAGIRFADKINTVSATYAREIQTEACGQGLDGLLRSRRSDLSGIVNGIDYAIWNPASDPFIAEPFTLDHMAGKAVCKRALQERLTLPVCNAPLFSMVSRLVSDKGIDLTLGALDTLVRNGAQLAILGTGDRHYEMALEQAAARYPDQISVVIGYNEALSHQIYAGSDFFLMPSLTEPCGLSQMYSLAYGALPVVRKTGGLADTITDASPVNIAKSAATGIVFRPPTSEALARAILRAIHIYHNPETFHAIQRNGMHEDLSWSRASSRYLELYRKATAKS